MKIKVNIEELLANMNLNLPVEQRANQRVLADFVYGTTVHPGLRKNYISQIKNGKRDPRLSELAKIREFFSCSWNDLLTVEKTQNAFNVKF